MKDYLLPCKTNTDANFLKKINYGPILSVSMYPRYFCVLRFASFFSFFLFFFFFLFYMRFRLSGDKQTVEYCLALFFFTFLSISGSVHCSWTHKFHFLSIFSLKMGPTALFIHLKIILLQYFKF